MIPESNHEFWSVFPNGLFQLWLNIKNHLGALKKHQCRLKSDWWARVELVLLCAQAPQVVAKSPVIM